MKELQTTYTDTSTISDTNFFSLLIKLSLFAITTPNINSYLMTYFTKSKSQVKTSHNVHNFYLMI